MPNTPVFQCILSRRDERKFKETPIAKETIEKLIEAAIWAPNHKWTEPWRFVAISDERKKDFIEAYCRGIKNLPSKFGPLDSLLNKSKKVKNEFEKVPTFIAVAYKKHEKEITDRENLITVACGVQNLLLAAEELGISAHWGSGKATRTPEITSYLNFQQDEVIIGILHMGYPLSKSTSKRSDVKKFLRWI